MEFMVRRICIFTGTRRLNPCPCASATWLRWQALVVRRLRNSRYKAARFFTAYQVTAWRAILATLEESNSEPEEEDPTDEELRRAS